MIVFSSIMLALSSIIAAIVLYRQPHKLTDNSKVIVSIIKLCCFAIFANSIIAVIIDNVNEDSKVLRTIFYNLQFYLAIPLLGSALLSTSLDKHFTKGTWGRWSLALLATFELCRRANVSDYYDIFLIVSTCCIMGVYCFYDIKKSSANILISSISFVSYAMAMLLFSENALLLKLTNVAYFNFSFGLALILICFKLSQKNSVKH